MQTVALLISIHALAKRATVHYKVLYKVDFHFNPRPRKEGDLYLADHAVKLDIFQSTPSQRGRPSQARPRHRTSQFQSTPSQRGRLYQTSPPLRKIIFQSTPSQRGRQGKICGFLSCQYFNPRPRKEGDKFLDMAVFSNFHFNPRPRKEGDHIKPCLSLLIADISIHALAKRATSPTLPCLPYHTISIHALAKRATVNILLSVYLLQFQSTPSQRGRQQIYTMIIYILKLNITFRTFFLYKIIKN